MMTRPNEVTCDTTQRQRTIRQAGRQTVFGVKAAQRYSLEQQLQIYSISTMIRKNDWVPFDGSSSILLRVEHLSIVSIRAMYASNQEISPTYLDFNHIPRHIEALVRSTYYDPVNMKFRTKCECHHGLRTCDLPSATDERSRAEGSMFLWPA